MDIKVFKTFLEVTKTRHFGKAADNLCITQAAVSARIRQLEEFIDTSLFVRNRNNILLTLAGERLVPYAEVMVRTIQQAKTDIGLAENKIMQLTLSATHNIWDAYLQSCLTVITDAFEGYAFKTESLSLEQLHRAVMDKTLDIAVMFDPIQHDGLVVEKIADVELILVSTHKVSAKQALAEKYVYVDWGTRFALTHAELHRHSPPPFLHTSTGRIALDFILQKGGATYLPMTMVSAYLASEVLHAVEAQSIHRSLYAAYRKKNSALSSIQKIVQVIEQSALSH